MRVFGVVSSSTRVFAARKVSTLSTRWTLTLGEADRAQPRRRPAWATRIKGPLWPIGSYPIFLDDKLLVLGQTREFVHIRVDPLQYYNNEE